MYCFWELHDAYFDVNIRAELVSMLVLRLAESDMYKNEGCLFMGLGDGYFKTRAV